MKKTINIFLFALVMLEGTASNAQNTQAPPTQQVNRIDERKLEIAKELTSWLRSTLQSEKALVAVVARKGGKDAKKHDKTGMAHSGLAVYDPRAKTYIIYNLLNSSSSGQPLSKIYRTAPVNFFYGQTGYETNALIMLPDEITQKRIYEAILDGRYKKLFFTNKYNLLAHYASSSSMNCNKWLLMNVVAARIDDYDVQNVLQTIEEGFNVKPLDLSILENMVVRKKKNVRASEIQGNRVYTVTVESLYLSRDLFPKSYFYKESSK